MPTHTHTTAFQSCFPEDTPASAAQPNTLQLLLPHFPVKVEIPPKTAACNRLQLQTPGGCQRPRCSPGQRRSRITNQTPWCDSHSASHRWNWSLSGHPSLGRPSAAKVDPCLPSERKVKLKMEGRELSYLWFPDITIILLLMGLFFFLSKYNPR